MLLGIYCAFFMLFLLLLLLFTGTVSGSLYSQLNLLVCVRVCIYVFFPVPYLIQASGSAVKRSVDDPSGTPEAKKAKVLLTLASGLLNSFCFM